MTELSPAAQAVLDAALPVYDDENLYVAPMEKHAGMIAAAALRAAANEIDDLFCESGLDDRDGLEFAIGHLFWIARAIESQ